MIMKNENVLFQNQWIKVVSRDWDNLDHPYTAVVPRTGVASCIIPIRYTVNGPEVLMLSQPRLPSGGLLWEFPAGGVDDGETPSEAAIRELGEEINIWVEPDDVIFLGSHHIAPTLLDELLYCYAVQMPSTYDYSSIFPQAGEIDGYQWITVADAYDKCATDPAYNFAALGKLVLLTRYNLLSPPA